MFTSSASRNSSAVRLGNRVDRASAALLIRMSIRPKRSRAPRASASGNPGTVTSPAMPSARSPRSLAATVARA